MRICKMFKRYPLRHSVNISKSSLKIFSFLIKLTFLTGEEAGSSTIFRSDEKRSDSSKNVFGKPELKIKPHITELNPPSTVLYPVSSPDSVFGGELKLCNMVNLALPIDNT